MKRPGHRHTRSCGHYRKQVANDPQRITSDFQLTGAELRMLMAVSQTTYGTRQQQSGHISK